MRIPYYIKSATTKLPKPSVPKPAPLTPKPVKAKVALPDYVKPKMDTLGSTKPTPLPTAPSIKAQPSNPLNPYLAYIPKTKPSGPGITTFADVKKRMQVNPNKEIYSTISPGWEMAQAYGSRETAARNMRLADLYAKRNGFVNPQQDYLHRIQRNVQYDRFPLSSPRNALYTPALKKDTLARGVASDDYYKPPGYESMDNIMLSGTFGEPAQGKGADYYVRNGLWSRGMPRSEITGDVDISRHELQHYLTTYADRPTPARGSGYVYPQLVGDEAYPPLSALQQWRARTGKPRITSPEMYREMLNNYRSMTLPQRNKYQQNMPIEVRRLFNYHQNIRNDSERAKFDRAMELIAPGVARNTYNTSGTFAT